ncbi:unnamed protein product [Anisakis simplex]|uniref:SSD domain-containing protein n=1 Tax=Anisakis simplex TaxID=6269 RepID=A0A0M3IYV6_ANISI|nr:unnamed protein product [Anisakis simplex]
MEMSRGDKTMQTSVVKSFKLFILHYMDLKYALLSRDLELEEQRKITIVSLPYLAITGLILTVFLMITLIDIPLYRSQIIESVMAVLSPSMALITTAGCLWGIGVPFSNILTAVPFLVITIGVDDAFLILAAWRHSNTSLEISNRTGESLAKSGASITVTSLTDILCFAVGIISAIPVVRLFCLYTAIALTVDFIYQITFFASCVVFCAKRQARIEEEIRMKTNNNMASAYLSTLVDANFTMENLYLEESELNSITKQMQTFVLKESFNVNFAVNPCPNFSHNFIRIKFNEMVQRLENITPFGRGKVGTNLWTRDFQTIISFWDGDESDLWKEEVLLKNYRELSLDEKYINIGYYLLLL